MASQIYSDEFQRFCAKDVIQFHKKNEKDSAKVHLRRSINFQMYQEADILDYHNNTLCSVLHDDLVEYTKLSEHTNAEFHKIIGELGVDISRVNVECSMENPKTILKSKKCANFCKNDAKEDINNLFSSAVLHSSATSEDLRPLSPQNSVTNISDGNTKFQPQSDDNEICLDLKFSRIKNVNVANLKTAAKNYSSPFSLNQASTNLIRDIDKKVPTFNRLPDFHKKTINTENETRNHSLNTFAHKQFFSNKRKFENDYDNNYGGASIQSRNQFDASTIENNSKGNTAFTTGLEELEAQYEKKYGNGGSSANQLNQNQSLGVIKKSLGGRRTVQSKFVSPFQKQSDSNRNELGGMNESDDSRLKNIDPKMIELIRNEIMDIFSPVAWDSIAGLEYAKTIIKEAIVWPMLRPDIFTGLRRPPRGILLFGPPGTGKTLIGKCIASQSNSTFFSISASSLTSKWIGEGEKMVRALFAVASVHQPAVIFIDEIDSLLCQRSETEHESSRRIKTEFLVQLDGAATTECERILIVGATNRPQELDEAARRRLVKRLYIPLPELPARMQILNDLLKSERSQLSSAEMKEIARLADGFSGADMKVLCHEASMGPIRSIPSADMNLVDVNDVRPVSYDDFRAALRCVRASVSQNDLQHYVDWDKTYGSGAEK